MFELAGTKYHHGVFELILDHKLPGGRVMGFFLKLGSIRGRLLALGFFLLAGFLEAFKQPLRLALNQGWFSSVENAVEFQKILTGSIMGLGFLLYVIVFTFRSPRLRLMFDKMDKTLRFEKTSIWARTDAKTGVVPFSNIKEIQVFKNGIELKTFGAPSLGARLRFDLLTDEQRIYFPLNLSKITGLTPTGDWVDPESELVGSASVNTSSSVS
jgi:hypothetical protein